MKNNNNGLNKIDINNLFNIEEKDYRKLYEMLLETFADYPKLALAFENWDDRQAAIGMTVSYYLKYDLVYGSAYSLDENVNEAIAIVHSDNMDYSEERCNAANCENEDFKEFSSRLTPQKIQLWWDFFEEFDRKEAELDIPKPHIYVDYVGVRKGMYGQGQGTKIIRLLEQYADDKSLPIMLFTNGADDVRFYLKNGFKIIGVTKSEEYKFENTYLLYEPKGKYDQE